MIYGEFISVSSLFAAHLKEESRYLSTFYYSFTYNQTDCKPTCQVTSSSQIDT